MQGEACLHGSRDFFLYNDLLYLCRQLLFSAVLRTLSIMNRPFIFYNTLSRREEEFVPAEEGKVGFYGCGPTVYNYAHIGNLRAYVLHDTLARALRRGGYEVTQVMNITDVGHLSGDGDEGEDKMIKSAKERGKAVLEIAQIYTDAFFADTDRLNILRPSIVCKATDHIPEMIAMIERIEKNGFAYNAGGNIYFDTAKDPGYGKLARLKADTGEARARAAEDGNKKSARDFALWFTRSKFDRQALVWDSPWGTGYPGWHIECSAMSMKYLGDSFDIHCGGADHIPVHHTNEIAQSEAATGKSPYVRYWLHNEFLVMGKDKMSKSSGGFLTLQSLVDRGYHPLDYRYLLLGAHYRSQLQFSFEALDGAKSARRTLSAKIRALAARSGWNGKPEGEAGSYGEAARARIDEFDEAMRRDLSTPRALAALWGLLKDPAIEPGEALRAALDMDEALGLGFLQEANSVAAGGGACDETGGSPNAGSFSPEEEAEIRELVERRAEAKKARDFAKADEIRAALRERGIVLEDGPGGTSWRAAD